MEKAKDEHISFLKKELDVHQSYALKAIDRNCMMGEDFRSQAHDNYNTIVALRADVERLSVEPARLVAEFLKIETKYKRKIENYNLQNEDHQVVFTSLHQTIE